MTSQVGDDGAESYRAVDLRLKHPALDFWVDVRLLESQGRWMAVADLASTPEVGVASRPDLAILLALWPLGQALARRMATQAVRLEGAARSSNWC